MPTNEANRLRVRATDELATRPRRPADYARENEALRKLGQELAHSPESVFQILTDEALSLCRAQSAGVSLIQENSDPYVFRWVATAGLFAGLKDQTLPRAFSPCGVVLDHASAQLMRSPELEFPYIKDLGIPVHEVLLVPFFSGETAIGTVWAVAHEPDRHFDGEDVRLLESLSQYASSACKALNARREIERMRVALSEREQEQTAALNKLATAQRRLDSALIAAELGVYEWDVGSDRLFGDSNFRQMFQVTLDASGAAPLQDYVQRIHPEDRERALACVARSVETGENFECDYRVVLPAGERWINSRGRMHRDDTGRVVKFYGVVLDVTERRRAEVARESVEQELRRVAEMHDTVLSATEDFAYVFNTEGQFVYANRRLLTVWAKALSQIVGKTCLELGYPKWHADMHMREIREVIATRLPIRGEVPFTGDSGIYGIYDYIFTPVFGPDSQVILVAGTTRDVTERRRLEDRDKFLVLLDDATRPLTDPREITQTTARLLAQHLHANRCAYADVEADENTFNLTGDYNHQVASIIGRYRFDQFGPDCLRLMRTGQPFVVEDVRRDARTTDLLAAYEATQIRSVICVPLRKAGHFVAAMAVHQNSARAWRPADVELVQLVANRCWEAIERSRVLRALTESEQQLRLAVSTGRFGVWELNLQTEELSCSSQCKANYGIAEGTAFTYDDYWKSVHPDEHARVRDAIRLAVEKQAEIDLEYRTLWPDGSVHWVLVRGQASYAVHGAPLKLSGVSLDITARKQVERDLVRLHEEAIKASRAKDDFLAALSHELRTPLNPVLLLASESAADNTLPSRAREAFEIIRNNVELEARLIDDLLDITGIARGKVTIRREPLAVHPLLQEAASTLANDFAAKGITLVLDLSASRSTVAADGVRLLQIAINLLRNAVKFTPSGGQVEISTRVTADERLEFVISDNGIGITQSELARVFQAFEQGEHAVNTGSHKFGGLGLGLAIARQLVELHQGTIHAESAGRDQGTRMIVRLPLTVAPAASPASKGPSLPTSPVQSQEGRRILLIEDHEPTQRALKRLLERRKFHVTNAGSVTDARRIAEGAQFDVVISDIGLPDGDGAELMAELGTRFGLRGIALTGYGMEQDIARYQAAGFVAHLIKPVRIDHLDAALARLT